MASPTPATTTGSRATAAPACCAGAADESLREASAVFDSAADLQAAVDDLLGAHFARADLSVLGSEAALHEKFGAKLPDARQLADDPATPRAGYVSDESRSEGLAAIVGIPVYVGGAGAAAVAALEGATIVATAGAALGVGLTAGALGLYVARRMEKRHAGQIDKHLEQGGLVLWVRIADKAAEVSALKILRNRKAHDIRVHQVLVPAGADAVPFHDAQPDPFLAKT
jgi:hypothetical protein